jgi:hypothetical protein
LSRPHTAYTTPRQGLTSSTIIYQALGRSSPTLFRPFWYAHGMSDIGSCLGAALRTWQRSCFTKLKQSVPRGANRLSVCPHYQGRRVRAGCNRGADWIRQLAVFCDRIALAKRAGFQLLAAECELFQTSHDSRCLQAQLSSSPTQPLRISLASRKA